MMRLSSRSAGFSGQPLGLHRLQLVVRNRQVVVLHEDFAFELEGGHGRPEVEGVVNLLLRVGASGRGFRVLGRVIHGFLRLFTARGHLFTRYSLAASRRPTTRFLEPC